MRWFLGLLLLAAMIAGAYGYGRFFMSNDLEVTRTITIERPRAAVFAMMNDLRIAKEWSPYYARDPDAEFAISEQPGPGQTMRWVSDVREVGRGRMAIVDTTEYEQIEAILDKGDNVRFDSRMDLRRVDTGTHVTWTLTAACREGWINVPCRYMNLVLQNTIRDELDEGLARLKTLAEQLPAVDFEGLEIIAAPVAPMDVIFVDLTLASGTAPTFADRAAAEAEGINALNNFFASTADAVTRTNEIVRVFPANNGANGRYSFSIGYPFSGPAPQRLIGVRVGQTPSGAALRVEYEGRRSQIPIMYQRIHAYMQAHRISARPGAEAWEVVHSTTPPPPDSTYPDDAIERTEIFFPID